MNILEVGRQSLIAEGQALIDAGNLLAQPFVSSVEEILKISGKVVVSGLGKSGHIARKIAATFSSTGTAALFLHPSEAIHGDLGVIQKQDLLLAIAFGGETTEVLEVAKFCKLKGIKIIAISGTKNSSLARLADCFLSVEIAKEICPHNLAPTTSTTLTLAMGDALAVSLMRARGFETQNFAEFHPGGSLGKKLLLVKDLMRKDVPTVKTETKFFDVIKAMAEKNYGVVPVLDDECKILGVISDGDIRRLLAKDKEDALKKVAKDFMSKNPKIITSEDLAVNAEKLMQDFQITSAVVSDSSFFKGLLRMHDLVN